MLKEGVKVPVEWFYATRLFRETGQAHLLSECLSKFEIPPSDTKKEDFKKYNQVKYLRESIDKVALKYAQALPLELGLQADDLAKRVSSDVPEHLKNEMPVPEEIFQVLYDFISPFSIPANKKIQKANIILSSQELWRQAEIIDTYIERGYINYALGLMREWIISAVIWHCDGENSNHWINLKKSRGEVEKRLGVIAELLKKNKEILSEQQVWLAKKWDYISLCRNMMHHHGFREDNAFLDQNKINEIKKLWDELKYSLEDKSKWNINIARGGGTLLISPLGLSKGLLYSALCHVSPDRLMVISSEKMKDYINEILENSEWHGEFAFQYMMEDPYSGFKEGKRLVKELTSYLISADKVFINITGGTTAMQYVVQEISKTASSLGHDVSEIALVDRRTPEEQKENPYVLGEIIHLNENKENGE